MNESAKLYEESIARLKNKTYQLLSSPKYTVQEISTNPEQHNVPGVYLLLTPDGSRIVYVGKTTTKSIAGRIKDHRDLDTSSDLKGMLILFKDYPQDRRNYLVRYNEVVNKRERTLLEHFLIAVLDPPFNK